VPETLDAKCPACSTGRGLARRVQTILGHRHAVNVTMTCQDCRHQWTVEQREEQSRYVELLCQPAETY